MISQPRKLQMIMLLLLLWHARKRTPLWTSLNCYTRPAWDVMVGLSFCLVVFLWHLLKDASHWDVVVGLAFIDSPCQHLHQLWHVVPKCIIPGDTIISNPILWILTCWPGPCSHQWSPERPTLKASGNQPEITSVCHWLTFCFLNLHSILRHLHPLQVADGEVESVKGEPVNESFKLSREEFKVQSICCICCRVQQVLKSMVNFHKTSVQTFHES